MKTVDPELGLRHDLSRGMMGSWRLTWHEDGSIGPGVPDASFVMLGPQKHQTGWLELKAIRTPKQATFRFKIEPSQHQWFADHVGLIPVYFLVAVGDFIFLVDGKHHAVLDEPTTIVALTGISVAQFTKNTIQASLPSFLRSITSI